MSTFIASTTSCSILIYIPVPSFATQVNPVWRGLMDYIVKLIICEVEAFLLVERDSFHSILKFCHPSLLDRDIPHCHTICTEIVQCAVIAEESVHEKLKNIPSRISFTFDAWTSAPGDQGEAQGYNLCGKVGWFTSNGAAINCTTLHMLQTNPLMDAEWMV
ncbi:hypothetical protein EI94DRAFT_1703818 [Lactarius quietus]|nr:hypothetical protein EI94DRAFT_1703818 [Lactarius quietus]